MQQSEQKIQQLSSKGKSSIKGSNKDEQGDTVSAGKYFYQKEYSVSRSHVTDASLKRLKQWVPSALGAICCFFIANSTASIVTNEVNGLACVFYLSSGGVLCGAMHNLWQSYQNYKEGYGFWNPQNIIVDGNFKLINLVRFAIQCCLFFGIQCFIFMTMYFSHVTGINVGIITTLWSIQPLFSAGLDRMIYGEPIRINHFIGMLMVIASGVAISMSGKIDEKVEATPAQPLVLVDEQVPKYVAVVFGVITPLWMIANSLFIKHLTNESIGFNATTVSFSSSGFCCTIIIILGCAWYWQEVAEFRWKLFLIGFFSSIFDTCGKACILKAFSIGPAGPVAAFVELNNVLLVLFEGLRLWHVPNYLEIIGFFLGICGALVLSIPKQLMALIRKILCMKPLVVVNESKKDLKFSENIECD